MVNGWRYQVLADVAQLKLGRPQSSAATTTGVGGRDEIGNAYRQSIRRCNRAVARSEAVLRPGIEGLIKFIVPLQNLFPATRSVGRLQEAVEKYLELARRSDNDST